MRLTPGDELDLRWYELEAGAALGERSPLGAQLEMMRFGLSPTGLPRGPDLDRAVGVIRRYEAVRARLGAMSRRRRSVLMAAYCGVVTSLASYDRLGPVALLTTAGREAYDRAHADGKVQRLCLPDLARWLGQAMRTDAALREAVLAEADRLLSDACGAWTMAGLRLRRERDGR